MPTTTATNTGSVAQIFGPVVDVRFERKLAAPITLATLREHSNGALKGLALLQRGNRLSITPVSAAHWQFILSLER